MDQLKEAAQKLKDKITNNPLEKLLNEATADVNWNASNKILQEIADHTYSFGDFTEVMKFIWKKLASERKQWRKILKTLSLIEYLIKNGSPRCVQEFKSEIYLIRTLQDFSHYEDGQDRGAAIREVSKRVVQLLNDDTKIDEERKKAQEIRERLGGNLGAAGSGGQRSGGSYGGFSSKEPGRSTGSGGGSYSGYGGSTGSGDVRKTKDWRVEKNNIEEPQRNRETEKDEGYVTKAGTKYEAPEIKNDREEEQASKSTTVKKFAPPKGMKGAPQQQQQQQVDLFEVDTPAPVQQETKKATAAPVNNNAGFEWDAPQAAPQKSDNIWNWDQGQQPGNAQPAQPTQPANQGGFNWNQAPAQPTQPTNVQNLYQQQPQSTNQFGGQGFNFGNAPQQNNNVNNLTSQLNNLNFNATPAYNFGGNVQQTQPTQPAQPTNNVANLLSSSPPTKTDGFDDFQTAKNTGPNVNEYKNYSQQEKSIIDLSDFSSEANKKQTQKEKIEVSKHSNEGFLYSSKDELDNFFVPNQPVNNMNMNMNMGGGFNQGMMNQGMRNMGGMPQMGGMGQMGGMPNMGGMPQMGGMGQMGGMQQMGGMGQMGGMPQMGMNMGYQNMGMGQNPGFNPGMMNMQGNFGNQQQMGGFGYR